MSFLLRGVCPSAQTLEGRFWWIEKLHTHTHDPGKLGKKADHRWPCLQMWIMWVLNLKCKCRATFCSFLKKNSQRASEPDIALQPRAETIHYSFQYSYACCFFSCILNVGVGKQCCRAHCITSYSLYIYLLTGNTTDKDGGQKLAHKKCLFCTSRCPIIPVYQLCRC